MNASRQNLLKKITGATIGFAMVLSSTGFVVPPRAHALFGVGDIVLDPTNLVQNIISATGTAAQYTLDYVLNTLAWQVANLAIDSVVKSTVNWINSGFQGSPAFVTDLNKNLQGVGDAVADRFFDELTVEAMGRMPFQDKVLDSVRLGYYLSTSPESFYTRYPSTLNQVSPDSKAFLRGDFNQGGFNAFFATVMNPSNNPYGAQMLANQALENAVAGATGNRLEELSWNRGFLSWRGECLGTSGQVDLSGKEQCDSYEIKTPGSVIMESLNKTSFAGIDRLVNADQFNEIIGALMNQLVGKVLGTNGVRGVSQPSAGGGSSFLDQSTDSSQGGSGATIANNFSSTVMNQIRSIEDYRTNWTKIRDAARAAEQRCGPNTRVQSSPAEVLERAGTALVKAEDAVSILSSIQEDVMLIKEAGGNQTQALYALTEEYNELVSSSKLMSAMELTEAQLEAQDTGDMEPGSLYSQMTRLSNTRFCGVLDT